MLEQQRGSKLAAEKGESLLARLRQGESLVDVAVSEGRGPKQPGDVRRNDTQHPRPIIQSLFRMPRPEGDRPVYGKAVLDNGDFAVIILHKVQDGSLEGMNEAARTALRRSLESSSGRSNFGHLVKNLRANAEVILRESRGQ